MNALNYRSYVMVFVTTLLSITINAQNRTAVADGPWENAATWGGAAPPTSANNVFINNGVDVTISSAAQCNSIRFRDASGSITVNSTFTLDVSTNIRLESLNAGNTAALLAGAGTINCATLLVGFNQASPSGDRSTILTVNVAALNVSSDVTVRSEDNVNNQNNATLSIGAVGVSTVSIGGTLLLSSDNDGGELPTSTVNLNNGGHLSFSGATPVSTIGNYIFDADGNSARATYAGANQPIFPATYARLVVEGSGTKTLTGITTINTGLELNAGTLVAGNFLTIGNSSPSISRGNASMTGVIQGANSYNVSYGGDSKTTGDELTGSNLRDFIVAVSAGAMVTLDRNVAVGRDAGIANNASLDIGSFIFTGGTNFNMGGNSLFRIGGTNSIPDGFNAFGVNSSSTIEFYGTNQLVDMLPSGSYTNLILSGSGVKTFVGETILGTLSIRGTATTAGVSPVYGGNAVLRYQGSIPQTTGVEFVGGGANPANVIIDNVNGVSLSGAKTVNGTLTLTNGYLTTNAIDLLTINTTGSAITQNGAFVNGPLAKAHLSSTGFSFPVGNVARGLRPASFTPQVTGASTFTVSFEGSNPKAISGNMSGGITQISGCEYWDISQTGTVPVQITLSWNGTANNCGTTPYITNTGSLVVAHFDGTSWTNEGQSAVTGTAADGGTITSSNYITTFSPFTIGTTNAFSNPLPVMFTDVKAFQKNNGVQIEWTNLTERDLVKYEVERSANGQTFTKVISEQLPRSNNNDKESYVAFDASPLNGANFYRVKVYEIGGKIIYSKILKVDMSGKGVFALYPNPVEGGQLSVSMRAKQGQYTLKVVNATGQEIYRQRLTHQGGFMTQTINLPASVKPGMYSMTVDGEDYREVKTFVVQ